MKAISRSSKLAAVTGALFLLLSGAAGAQDNMHSGRADVYNNLHDDSLEQVSTPEAIMAVTRGSVAPTEIWRVLEHGEKVECLSCIPAVSKLLYHSAPRAREISAWWLRRRIFGVFGPGQVYSQVVDSLANDTSETRRAYAADALGEFLVGAGVKHVARALSSDASPLVRTSAARALMRLNDEGPNGELGMALADSNSAVRLAAIKAVANINTFSRPDLLVERLWDDDAGIRRTTAEVIGTMRLGDSVMSLIPLVDPENEANPEVRKAAVAALGNIGDPEAREAVEAAQADPDFLVRSAARIALQRL